MATSSLPLARLMRSCVFIAVAVLCLAATSLRSQSLPTATRVAEGQAGILFENAESDYARSRFNGYGAYADLDFRHHIGIEAEYRYISDQDDQVNIFERSYEVGARYSRHFGRLQPYGKLMLGRGTFNYPYNVNQASYNMFAGGLGTDIRIVRRVNARVEYEYQDWFNFPPTGLTPSHLSLGVAYHFK